MLISKSHKCSIDFPLAWLECYMYVKQFRLRIKL